MNLYLLYFAFLCCNPFINKVAPNSQLFSSFEIVTYEDRHKYLIYEETHKITNPNQFNFLNYPIKFLAFKSDSLNCPKSIVIYFNANEDLFKKLDSAFGAYKSSSTVEANIAGLSDPNLVHRSFIWQKEDFIMLVTLTKEHQRDTCYSEHQKLAGIWIKKISK